MPDMSTFVMKGRCSFCRRKTDNGANETWKIRLCTTCTATEILTKTVAKASFHLSDGDLQKYGLVFERQGTSKLYLSRQLRRAAMTKHGRSAFLEKKNSKLQAQANWLAGLGSRALALCDAYNHALPGAEIDRTEDLRDLLVAVNEAGLPIDQVDRVHKVDCRLSRLSLPQNRDFADTRTIGLARLCLLQWVAVSSAVDFEEVSKVLAMAEPSFESMKRRKMVLQEMLSKKKQFNVSIEM